MDLPDKIISFIDALGVVQGLLFGLMLVSIHSKKSKPTLYLGLFIMLFSLEPIPNILHDLKLLEKFPQLELLPVGFHFLAYPLLLIYIEKISIFNKRKIRKWTLYPGYFEVIFAVIVFFLPTHIKLEIKDSYLAILYFILGLSYAIFISYLILKRLHKHIVELENQYTLVYDKKLVWFKQFIYVSILFHVLLLLNFFIENHVLYTWISILNVVLIYWVSYKGIVQDNVGALTWEERLNSKLPSHKDILGGSKRTSATKGTKLNLTNDNASNLISKEEATVIFAKIEDHVKKSECYLNDKLTIIDIAEAIHIHPKRISYCINSIASLNFNNYINFYRVKLAKELLKSEEMENLSIKGIGLEAGFHSKTSFYNAFKRFEKMTPAQYKNL